MTWIVLSLISATTLAISNIFQKVLMKDEDSDPVATSILFHFTVAFILGIFALFNGISFPNLVEYLPNLALMAILYLVANISIFAAFKDAEASDVSIILSSRIVFVLISASLFLGETITIYKIMAIFTILFGIFVVNYTSVKREANTGYLYALIGALCIGLANTNDAIILNKGFDLLTYIPFSFFLPGFFTLLWRPKALKTITSYSLSHYKSFVLTGLFYGIAISTIYMAYQNGGEASVIFPIQQLSIALTVILGFIFLRERTRLVNKAVGISLIILGAILIS